MYLLLIGHVTLDLLLRILLQNKVRRFVLFHTFLICKYCASMVGCSVPEQLLLYIELREPTKHILSNVHFNFRCKQGRHNLKKVFEEKREAKPELTSKIIKVIISCLFDVLAMLNRLSCKWTDLKPIDFECNSCLKFNP